eukprot:9245004-Pyramimonas_sp.AAC.3
MNNRRLWVLKAAHAKGLLKDGTVPVRVQQVPQTKRLKDRFEIDKCALAATFMRERINKEKDESAAVDTNEPTNSDDKQTNSEGEEEDEG